MRNIYKQLTYSLEDFKENKGANIILFFQIAISLLLIGYIVNLIFNISFFKKTVTNFEEYESMYMINDYTEESKIESELYYSDNIVEKQKEFYKYMNEHDKIDTYVCLPDAYMSDKSKSESFIEIRINKNTIDLYKLTCDEGRLFDEIDFNSTEWIIPIVIGNKLGEIYDVGDIVEDRYEVIGILRPNSYYFDMHYGATMITLDDKVVMPIQINKYNSFSDYHMLSGYTYIMAKDSKAIYEIEKKLNELNLYYFEFKSFNNYLKENINEIKVYIQSILFFLLIVLVFSIICMMFNLIQFIEDHRYELILHLLCGATIYDLIKRIFIQIGIVFFLVDCIILIIFKISYISLIVVIIGIIIHFIISVGPIYRLSKLQIAYEMRRN